MSVCNTVVTGTGRLTDDEGHGDGGRHGLGLTRHGDSPAQVQGPAGRGLSITLSIKIFTWHSDSECQSRFKFYWLQEPAQARGSLQILVKIASGTLCFKKSA